MSSGTDIPVIDLFAGPGGLGEGFSAFAKPGHPPFKIALSVEKEPTAHQTLLLRAFYRQFPRHEAPPEYYHRLEGRITTADLFQARPEQAEVAQREAWHATLGDDDSAPLPELRRRVSNALCEFPDGEERWVLIGGPPCQAYSLAGRSRNKGIHDYSLAADPKARLYLEYLQLIADFWPAVFVMENVKGLLSARMDGESIFDRIATDLSNPSDTIRREGRQRRNRSRHTYTLRALTRSELFPTAGDYLIRSEEYGIPQARHRVIIIGIRDDVAVDNLGTLTPATAPTVMDMIRDLPQIRSGLSKEPDSDHTWYDALADTLNHEFTSEIKAAVKAVVASRRNLPLQTRGDEFLPGRASIEHNYRWFVDKRLKGFCNHATRSHIRLDLQRYLFAACFAAVRGHSPELADFPTTLYPKHRNVGIALGGSHFADRFRVQVGTRPSTTITSHISKDGHYYIHPDPLQCRSLTVREAARLQTFPDNYLFEGPRTAQYTQVGNAVPPLLAHQIAALVAKLF